MRWGLLSAIAGLLLVGGVGALFVVQNSSRTTQLSLDLGIKAGQLAQPVQIPALMGLCLGLGVVLGAGPFLWRNLRLAGQVRELESRLAMEQAQRKDGAPGREPGAW